MNAALDALPAELVSAIAEYLDFPSAVSLASTCRDFGRPDYFLGRAQVCSWIRAYLAVRNNDRHAFKHELEHGRLARTPRKRHSRNRRLRSDPRSESRDPPRFQLVHACMFVLLIGQQRADANWWTQLLELATLTSRSPMIGESLLSNDSDIRWRAMVLLVCRSIQRRHWDGLHQLTSMYLFAALHPTPFHDKVGSHFFGPLALDVCRNHSTFALGPHEQLRAMDFLLPMLQDGRHFQRVSSDSPDSDSLADVLAASNNLALIVKVYLHFEPKFSSPVTLVFLLDSCYRSHTATTKALFRLLLNTYLVGYRLFAPVTTLSSTLLVIDLPDSLAQSHANLAANYLEQGVSESDFDSFTKSISCTSFERDIVPLILSGGPVMSTHPLTAPAFSQRPYLQNMWLLLWLIDHAHMHLATVHCLPYHCHLPLSPTFVTCLLSRLPIDTHTHTASRPCNRCESLSVAAENNPQFSHLTAWHLSSTPMPRADQLAQAQRVSAFLSATSGPAPTAAPLPAPQPSLDWYILFHDLESKLTRARALSVNWDARALGCNMPDLASLVRIYVDQARYADAVKAIEWTAADRARRALGAADAVGAQDVAMTREMMVRFTFMDEELRLDTVGDGESKRVEAELARVVVAVDMHGLVCAQVEKLWQYKRLVSWAVGVISGEQV